MNKNYDKTIKDMYSKINTPSYDPTHDVLRQIRSVSPTKVILKRILIVAVIICLALAGIGALKMVVINVVNLSGENLQYEYVPNPAKITPTPEAGTKIEYIDEYNGFLDNVPQDELRLVINKADNSGGMNIPSIDILNYTELESLVKKTVFRISIPSYIPDGYAFLKGGVNFFLGEDVENSILISSQEDDDKIYEIYQLPKDFNKYVDNIGLDFENESGDKLRFHVFLTFDDENSNPIERNITDTISTKTPKIEGFEKALLLHDSSENPYYLNELVLYNKIEPVKEIKFFMYISHPERFPDKSERYRYITRSGVLYIISSDGLSENELIKIAESLK